MSLPPDVRVVRTWPAEAAEQRVSGGRQFTSSTGAEMGERGARPWFYCCKSTTQREREERTKQLSEMPQSYKERILKEFNVSQVLPRLVYEGVFSLKEYREILSWDCGRHRVESFFLKLWSKGPKAFCAFCSHLEDFCPYQLTCFFLYYQEQTQRILQDASTAEEKTRVGTQPEPSNALETEDREQSLHLFNKYRLSERKDLNKPRTHINHGNGSYSIQCPSPLQTH